MAQLLLALVLLLGLPSAPAAQSLFRRDTMPNITCNGKTTRLLGKLVTIRPEDMCKDFGLAQPSVLGCTLLDIMDVATQQVTSSCAPLQQAEVRNVSKDGKPIPAPLRDRRPLPDGPFDDEPALLEEEGATMYWHITNVINLFFWAPCDGVPHAAPWHVPKGWTALEARLVRDALTPEARKLPAYYILRSEDGRRLAVIIRGTRTAAEWRVDMTYAQVRDPAYPGLMSHGFSYAAGVLWPMLEAALLSEVVNGSVTEVSISGHSLGAAMATMLSYRAQLLLDEKLPAAGKGPVKVDALLFAPPQVGDAAFAAAFNKRVNARRIAFKYDVVPQVPCAPQMMACKDVLYPSATVDGVTSWQYSKVGGQILIGPDGISVQPKAWSRLDAINGCEILPWGIAGHVCSYPCWFSKFAGAEDEGRCKLWADGSEAAAATSAAFCPTFPKHSPEFPLLTTHPRPFGSKLLVGGPITEAFVQAMWLERSNATGQSVERPSLLAKFLP